MLLPIGGGPISAVTDAPRLDFLSFTPCRPGRGYGAGPAAVKRGATGLVIVTNKQTNKLDVEILRIPKNIFVISKEYKEY